MNEILDFIYNGMDMSESLTPVMLVCFYTFMLVLECISSVIREIMKGAGMVK